MVATLFLTSVAFVAVFVAVCGYSQVGFFDRCSVVQCSSALPARVRRPAKYCDQLVCVSVCFFPLAYLKNHMSELHEIFPRAIPVIVARSASDSDNTLCTFGFVDDAMFSHSSSSSESCSRRGPSHRSTTMTTANSTPPQVECIARDDLTTLITDLTT